MSNWRQQQEMETERYMRALAILLKARRAYKDGYFTEEDIQDMQREFGLSTHLNSIQTGA